MISMFRIRKSDEVMCYTKTKSNGNKSVTCKDKSNNQPLLKPKPKAEVKAKAKPKPKPKSKTKGKKKTASVSLRVGPDKLKEFGSKKSRRIGMRNKWLVNRKHGQIVQNVTLTYDGQNLEFVERFPVTKKAKYDSLSIAKSDLDSPGTYILETEAWHVTGDEAKRFASALPDRGKVNVDWWGNTFGRKGHMKPPEGSKTYKRSLHMNWKGDGSMPAVTKQAGF